MKRKGGGGGGGRGIILQSIARFVRLSLSYTSSLPFSLSLYPSHTIHSPYLSFSLLPLSPSSIHTGDRTTFSPIPTNTHTHTVENTPSHLNTSTLLHTPIYTHTHTHTYALPYIYTHVTYLYLWDVKATRSNISSDQQGGPGHYFQQ